MEIRRQMKQRFSDSDGICPSHPNFILPATRSWAVLWFVSRGRPAQLS